MDIGTILAGIGSAASGGLLGVFGTGIKMWADHKAEQAKQAFELQMRKLDQEEMTLEHSLRMKEVEAETKRDIAVASQNRLATEAQAAADVEQGEMALVKSSYRMDKATYGGGFVDAIRGLMRPTLTLYFAILMAVISYQLMQINNGQWLDASEAQTMLRDVVNACIFLATTAVTWWFGSRPVKRG
ncbi:MAG: hypothetical protein COW76_20455 [Shewanella sp. CG18_big_fil_WC_8_21_14_2_50_42_11]|uniref:hypothetical protein n=1 Tax=Shewanella sp. CG18_big_fil_WC_8_21_14_2_50_42_11 TaxID=1975538 RepID=UPI000C46B55A|nr:hypothetical protein [Shewanella sp. CG18_big_fil_WC_8_21_14_2_50_42_11]PIP98536.1 MAG: hypothetical protein COW76_20455 [Shewanella sp. CG18_big_fil_WC_8_21_14_2_50_42_11]